MAADVSAIYDNNFPGAHDKMNTAFLNQGTNINRVTGSGGKSGAYEADTETMFMIKKTID